MDKHKININGFDEKKARKIVEHGNKIMIYGNPRSYEFIITGLQVGNMGDNAVWKHYIGYIVTSIWTALTFAGTMNRKGKEKSNE
jgi:hypothetical protein